MKVLYSWLKDYVDIDVKPDELVKKLFSSGLEVEEVKYLGENLNKVVVGRITSMEHYEGTHLQICRLDCKDAGNDIEILTGADNVYAGAKVPVALVGADLPCGISIAPRKMAGKMSYGMLCSGEELGLDKNWYPGADVNGIMILSEDAPVGMDIKEYLELDDYLFDIAVTANRPDCQSVAGIAREVAAFLHKEFKEPDYSYSEDGTVNENIHVKVLDKETCPRYLAHYVHDVKYMESPLWMKRRLIAVGHNAINAMVDITNYVLVEIGQPMHAFDLDTLEGPSVIVRRANNGEELITLDGKTRILNENNLLICDSKKAVGLAGVMGGLNSEITKSTREVLFESAKFLRDSVRKTARSLGLVSDAASRFEKGIDEYTVERGMARALHLTQQLGVAKISSSRFDESAGASTEKRVIKVQAAQIDDVLGIKVPQEEMVRILRDLQFDVTLLRGELTIGIPRFREDIDGHQDIAEEIIREYGYDKVVPTFLKDAQVTNGGLGRAQKKEMDVKTYLCTKGYYEVQTIAMTSTADYDMFMIPDGSGIRKAVKLINPITENLSIMRTFMAPSMVKVIENNIKSGNDSGRFFEIANIYLPEELPLTKPPVEEKVLCLGSYGQDEDFYSMKETLEAFAKYNDLKFTYKRGDVSYLHPGRTAEILCNGTKIGHFGQLRYEIVDSMNIATGKKADAVIFIAELNYGILPGLFKDEIRYKEASGYKKQNRDISIVIDKGTECAAVTDAISSCDERIEDVRLFDIFESEKLGSGKKSMAFTISMASDKEDITDSMADDIAGKAVNVLKDRFDAALRA